VVGIKVGQLQGRGASRRSVGGGAVQTLRKFLIVDPNFAGLKLEAAALLAVSDVDAVDFNNAEPSACLNARSLSVITNVAGR